MAGQLIVGLDVSTRARAEEIVTALGDSVSFYKIGYQCFYGADGFALGRELIAAGKKVFFDLKLLDIDNTIEKGVAAIAQTGAAMFAVQMMINVPARVPIGHLREDFMEYCDSQNLDAILEPVKN